MNTQKYIADLVKKITKYNEEYRKGTPQISDAEYDKLIDELIKYMDSGCKMEDIYMKRVDDFFKYHDHNNSKRCYF